MGGCWGQYATGYVVPTKKSANVAKRGLDAACMRQLTVLISPLGGRLVSLRVRRWPPVGFSMVEWWMKSIAAAPLPFKSRMDDISRIFKLCIHAVFPLYQCAFVVHLPPHYVVSPQSALLRQGRAISSPLLRFFGNNVPLQKFTPTCTS